VAAIPIRLLPLPGEALDSWLETYAHLLHVTVGDIFTLAGLDWDRFTSEEDRRHKLWLYHLDEPALAALSNVTGVPAATLASMTLSRYEGTGLAAATAPPPGLPRTPRWWRQPIGSRYCPRCLAANGSRWMLAWRIPWTFACTGCQVLLADTCPDCGRRHLRTRTGQPRHRGRCDLTGLPLPPPRPPRGGLPECTSDPADTAAIALPADGCVLRAQHHIDDLITALLAARGQPPELAALQQYLDDAHAVARAAVSALHGPVSPPAVVSAIVTELGAQPGTPGRDAGIEALNNPPHGQRRFYAPVIAFGATIADIMLHGRQHDPDPAIAAWLTGTTISRSSHITTSPSAMLLNGWRTASPALQAALINPIGPRLDTFYQLRYGIPSGSARIPDPGKAHNQAAAIPSLLWPGWALRLLPPEGFDMLRCRFGLGVMLMIASAGPADYHTAQELLGLQPVHGSRFATFLTRLREHGVLDPVLAAICQLARTLNDNGAPIDYARRRRLRSLSQAKLDTDGWRRSRYFLTHPDTWAHRRHASHADLPAAPVQERLAQLRLIELLTGTHPSYLPGPLQLPERYRQDYAEFVLTLPEPLARYLDHRARFLLRHGGIDEPLSWEPPFDWITGITWPGPHPDDLNPADLHPLLRSGLPVRAIAARLGTTPDHVRLAAARHPAPHLPAGSTAQVPADTDATPSAEQLRAFTGQGLGQRKIARITGCSERTIRHLLTGAGLRQPADRPHRDIDAEWLREQYQARCRSLKDIAAENRHPGRNPRRHRPQRGHPRPARQKRPRPPARQPRQTRGNPASRLVRFLPPRRRTAHPQAPGSPRAPQPQPRRPPPRHQARHLFPVTQDEDVAVVAGEDLRADGGPAGWVLAGPWCACWRGGGQSVVTSVTAARALCSSTMDLRPAQAAIRAWVARLLTARGRPRAASWIRVAASSLNSGSDRPASLR